MRAWAYYNEIDPFAAAWLRELIKAGHIAPGEVDERSIEDVVPTDLAGFTQCHFFAGIGVWSYALRCAGWPDDRPVWTGSCPCQPFSEAGGGKGFTDERHLWPAFFHLIRVCRPVTTFGEQVGSKGGLAWLDLVSSDLEGEGYACRAVDTCAAGFGAPHIRQRLYWVADAHGEQHDRSRRGWAGRRIEHTDGGEFVRVADALPTGRPEGWAGAGDRQAFGGWRADGVGDTIRQSLADVSPQGQEEGGAIGRSGTPRRLEHPSGIGRERGQTPTPGHYDVGSTPQRPQGQYGSGITSAHRLSEHSPGPVNGFWRDADWLYCRDGRWRPTQSLSEPLADGLADSLGYSRFADLFSLNPLKKSKKEDLRIGRLRGYGNAINAVQATEFIESAMPLLDMGGM